MALVPKQDSDGRIRYDQLLRQKKSDANKIIPHRLQDLLPADSLDLADPELQKPTADECDKIAAETREALEKLVNAKIEGSLPARAAQRASAPQYIRYTPSAHGSQFNSGASQRIIRMVEVQADPMEPPKFRINAKLPQAPSSPPPPVMHSPPRKITVQEQQEWKVPPCISNWKNSKGYTIPLDKRLAADGRGLQQTHVNEKFAKLADSLQIVERKSREAVELRAQEAKRRAQKEKEAKEEKLRRLAQQARDERAGIRNVGAGGADDDDDEDDEDSEEEDDGQMSKAERDQIRQERHRERQRERNLQRAAPEKRSRLERQRDISEQIALGLAGAARKPTGDVQFDQRLFNQSKGVGSGFGDDDEYGVYDKPWRSQAQLQQTLYRPKRIAEDDLADDLEAIGNTSKFVPDKGFAGADKSAKRDGPVEFEKAPAAASSSSAKDDDDDPFGLDKFLKDAKKASNPKAKEAKYEHRGSYKRSRRD